MTENKELLYQLEQLRSGFMQAYMRGAENKDKLLMVCMKSHYNTSNKCVVMLGGESVELVDLENFVDE